MWGKTRLFAVLTAVSVCTAQGINISGRVTNTSGAAIAGASVELETEGLTATTGSGGSFALTGGATTIRCRNNGALLSIDVAEKSAVSITTFSLHGKALSTIRRHLDEGAHSITLLQSDAGIYFYKVKSGGSEFVFKGYSIGGVWRGSAVSTQGSVSSAALPKKSSAAQSFNDVLTVTANGYLDYRMDITNPDTSGIEIEMTEEVELDLFSFFVTSLESMREVSGSEDGFGGDLRYGEANGLSGADKICAEIAELSMPGAARKQWRAFLSVTEGSEGEAVHAIDRVGDGPWYDRLGRVVGMTRDDLANTRPEGADRAIIEDLPNEWGIPNHAPDGREVDNHDVLTGSDGRGELYDTDPGVTCDDWTNDDGGAGRPRVGHSWPGGPSEHWINAMSAPGCGAGVNVGTENNIGDCVGCSGGYGGIYCFALTP
ncbi:hypothetical protein ACFL5V_12085 [Fibrobacterota bacterium]